MFRSGQDVSGAHPPGYGRAVAVFGDGQGDLNAGGNISLPAAPSERVALRFEKAIAGRGGAAADIESRRALIAAVDDVVKDRVIAPGGVDWLRIEKSIEYSTMPREFRGASSMS